MACNCGNQGSSEINTLSCSTQPSCTSNIASTCSCGCSPCQCGVSQVPTPVPFFNATTSAVQECHNSITIQQTFITSIATGKAFNMPACGASVTISIPGLQKIQVGSYIWNVTYGYLHVTSFNYLTSQITVKNECNLSNAAAGTLIPACTMFNVVDPPFETDSGCGGPGVFVLVDFVVPAIGGSTNLVVSGLVGLAVGMVVQIQSGRYTITDIVDATTITITNDTGAGGVPGTTVSAKDISGHCIAPVTPLLESPCDETPVSQGSIVVCKNGIPTTLDATTLGQVPVVVDAGTNEVEFQTLDLPTNICTFLTTCVTIVGTGVGTNAVIVVADCTIFSVGQIIHIVFSGIETVRWVINNITPTPVPPPAYPNEGSLNITSIDAVSATYTLGELVEVCADDCCEQIIYDIETGANICDYDWSSAQKTIYQSIVQNDTATLVVPVGSPPTPEILYGTPIYVYFENDTCNPMHVKVSIDYYLYGYFNLVQTGDLFNIRSLGYFNTDDVLIANPYPAPTNVLIFPGFEYLTACCACLSEAADPFNFPHWRTYTYTFATEVVAGHKLRVGGVLNTEYDCYTQGIGGMGVGTFTIDFNEVRINGIGVAVQAA